MDLGVRISCCSTRVRTDSPIPNSIRGVYYLSLNPLARESGLVNMQGSLRDNERACTSMGPNRWQIAFPL